MVAPVVALGGLVLGGLALAAFLSKDEEAEPGGADPTAPGAVPPELAPYLEVRNGIIRVRPAYQAFFLSEISKHQVQPVAPNVVSLHALGLDPATHQVASLWMAGELGKGRDILMAIDGSTLLRSVLRSEQASYAAASDQDFAVLAESTAVQPGATTVPGTSTTVPDLGSVLGPWLGGGGAIPPQQGGPGGEAAPGANTEAINQAVKDALEQLGYDPASIPDLGMPPGLGQEPPGAVDPYGVGSPYLFVIRDGDYPSALAQWYTGDFMRAEELRALNGLQKHGTGSATYYTPWKVNQVVKLPLTWNVAKGLPAPGSTSQPAAPGQGGQGGDVAPIPGPLPVTPEDLAASTAELLQGMFG